MNEIHRALTMINEAIALLDTDLDASIKRVQAAMNVSLDVNHTPEFRQWALDKRVVDKLLPNGNVAKDAP